MTAFNLPPGVSLNDPHINPQDEDMVPASNISVDAAKALFKRLKLPKDREAEIVPAIADAIEQAYQDGIDAERMMNRVRNIAGKASKL